MDRICRVLEAAIALALAVMVVLVFGNVVLRYGFNSGIAVSEEVSRWLFIWGTFLGAVVALHERAHLGMDMVVARLPLWGKKAARLLGQVLMLFILALLFKGSLEQVKINLDVEAPSTGAPMAIVHAAPLVFALLAGAILLLDLWRLLADRMGEDELVMVQESEEADQLRTVLAHAAETKRGPP